MFIELAYQTLSTHVKTYVMYWLWKDAHSPLCYIVHVLLNFLSGLEYIMVLPRYTCTRHALIMLNNIWVPFYDNTIY